MPDRACGDTAAGRRAFLLHSYAVEGERQEEWFIRGVRKYHRTDASLVNAVAGAGLVVSRLAEPLPAPGLASEEDVAHANARPTVLALRARRPSRGRVRPTS